MPAQPPACCLNKPGIDGPDDRELGVILLDLRNREVARLHDIIGQQAIERTTAALAVGPTTTPPPADLPAQRGVRRGFWAWLLGM